MRQVTVNSIGEYIRQQREQAKISLRQLSQAAGVSNPYLSQVERGLRKPSAEILQQIAKGLRISAEALYVQAGILEDRPADSGVRSALLADPGLSERQKQVLIEIYESFRRENGDSGKAPREPQGASAGTVRAGEERAGAREERETAPAGSSPDAGWPFQTPAGQSAPADGSPMPEGDSPEDSESRASGEAPTAPGKRSRARKSDPWASAVDPDVT
ncbi:MAG TPA: helix-turn-helix domain-containing protein [Streptosporangiaceae bacterium]|nr:helix-turn-helix domain-containing protein [Streptosporangiaceae bacterium]